MNCDVRGCRPLMRCGVAVTFTVALTVQACSHITDLEAVVGDYGLETVNGSPLPATVLEYEISHGHLALLPDGTYLLDVALTTPGGTPVTLASDGVYAVEDRVVSLTFGDLTPIEVADLLPRSLSDPVDMSGPHSADAVTLTDIDGKVWVFRALLSPASPPATAP